jgi:hypothetical protein
MKCLDLGRWHSRWSFNNVKFQNPNVKGMPKSKFQMDFEIQEFDIKSFGFPLNFEL